MSRRRRQIILSTPENVPTPPVEPIIWACDYEDPWPGRNQLAIDSWAPYSGSTIDLQQNNNNYNFHIVSSGVVLPQWDN